VVSYLADPRAGVTGLSTFIQRAARALEPHGLLLFDAAAPGRIAAGARNFAEGDGWAVGTVSEESGDILTRNVTTFRRDASGTWRRGHETHRLALLATETVLAHLEAGGFEARACESYGPVRFPPASSPSARCEAPNG
jgi:hypothetical protein